jgi:hypothetical protein
LADFSGYLAADELYDGPFCVLSAVDARRQRRLLYEVLDHNPTQVDILYFLARLHDRIRAHGRTVLGITTDGSPLYPQAIALALGDVPHQVCEFHILKCGPTTHRGAWRVGCPPLSRPRTVGGNRQPPRLQVSVTRSAACRASA